MGSTRRILGKYANLSAGNHAVDTRLARVVARTMRRGRNIVLRQTPARNEPAVERRLLKGYQEELTAAKGPTRNAALKRQRITTLANVTRAVVEMRRALGGSPTIYHLLAKNALKNGLNSHELKQFVRALSNISVSRKEAMTWRGLPVDIYRAILFHPKNDGANLPSSVEQYLFHQKGRALTSESIIHHMGMNWNLSHKKMLNAVMQLLEATRLVKKMPHSTGGTEQSVWAHAGHANPPIDYPCLSMEVLQQLAEKPQSIIEMTARPRDNLSPTPRQSSQFYYKSIQRVIFQLQQAGLIGKPRYATSNGKKIPIFRLTKRGRTLYDDSIQRGHLNEKLRQLLVGEKTE